MPKIGGSAWLDSARGYSDTPRRTDSPVITPTLQIHEATLETLRGEILRCRTLRLKGDGDRTRNGYRHTTTMTTSMESLAPTGMNRRSEVIPRNIPDTLIANPTWTPPWSSSESTAICDGRNTETRLSRASRVGRSILRSPELLRRLRNREYRSRTYLYQDFPCRLAVEAAVEVAGLLPLRPTRATSRYNIT